MSRLGYIRISWGEADDEHHYFVATQPVDSERGLAAAIEDAERGLLKALAYSTIMSHTAQCASPREPGS
jgi:hypothetical protein